MSIASPPDKLRKTVVQVVSPWINRNCSHRSSDVKVVNEKTIIYSDGSLEYHTPLVKAFGALCTATAKVYIHRSVTQPFTMSTSCELMEIVVFPISPGKLGSI
jgi:hypothetical protein